MSLSLYNSIVPAFRQTLAAVAGVLTKAVAFAAERGVADAVLIETRLAPDMLPFGYQVRSCAVHSMGAINGVRSGVFSPDMTPWPTNLAGLQALIATTAAEVEALTPGEVDGFVGGDMAFVFKATRMPFHAEDFLLSFSLPNFYFHATVAYAILRAEGVPLGKTDFLGRPRLKS